jgi:hypothetical protein
MFIVDSPGSRQLVRVATVARWLEKEKRTVRWYIETGKLPAVQIGKLWFVDLQAAKAFRPRCKPRNKVA